MNTACMDRAVRPIIANYLYDRVRNVRLAPKTSVSAFKCRTATRLFVSDSKCSAQITFAAKPNELRARQTKNLARVMQFRARASDTISVSLLLEFVFKLITSFFSKPTRL